MTQTGKPYLLFDAGGTLVFPDHGLLAEQAQIQGLDLDAAALFAAHCGMIHNIDVTIRTRRRIPRYWPDGYTAALLATIGHDGPAAAAVGQAGERYERQYGLWRRVYPYVEPTLAALADAGYRMSVISNADGRAAALLAEVGLAHYFERIFDSTVLGTAKPYPAIFHIALKELGLTPAGALYIGDMFFYDVWGANHVGMGALHLDPQQLYSGWPGLHLPDIGHLPGWLAEYQANPGKYKLFPAGNMPLTLD